MHPGLSFVASHCGLLRCYAARRNVCVFGHRNYEATSRVMASGMQRSRICASADVNETQSTLNLRKSLPQNILNSDLKTDEAAAAAEALFDDLADRPEYYLNIAGVLLGIALSCVVMSATVVALESIPILPDLLRMIGLAYLFWFLNKFLFSAAERQRLGDEVSEFVSGVRGGDASKLEQTEDA